MNYASSSRSEADEAGHYPHRNRNLSLPVKVSKRSEPLRKWTVTGTIEILVAKPKKGAAVDRVYRALADRAGSSIVPVGAIVLIEAPGGPVHWSPELVAILAYNCIVTTALGYFLWGKVLSMMPAATAGQVLMLTPIGGFVLSTLIFGGAVTADVLLSVALIVGGIFVTLRR